MAGVWYIQWHWPIVLSSSGPPRLARPLRPRPCLGFSELKAAVATAARHCEGLACQKLVVVALPLCFLNFKNEFSYVMGLYLCCSLLRVFYQREHGLTCYGVYVRAVPYAPPAAWSLAPILPI
jgi:hypothetical protein